MRSQSTSAVEPWRVTFEWCRADQSRSSSQTLSAGSAGNLSAARAHSRTPVEALPHELTARQQQRFPIVPRDATTDLPPRNYAPLHPSCRLRQRHDRKRSAGYVRRSGKCLRVPASYEASYVTGATRLVDGGITPAKGAVGMLASKQVAAPPPGPLGPRHSQTRPRNKHISKIQ